MTLKREGAEWSILNGMLENKWKIKQHEFCCRIRGKVREMSGNTTSVTRRGRKVSLRSEAAGGGEDGAVVVTSTAVNENVWGGGLLWEDVGREEEEEEEEDGRMVVVTKESCEIGSGGG